MYTNCLAEAAYYIESNGEAAIIDPLRDVNVYINKAKERNDKIKYVFETHFHADFVSGHVDLANATGASIVYGPTTMPTGFKTLIAQDGESFFLGKVKIKLIHTPGHTMESSCFLLYDENGKENALFTGDTLFIGDVGRPDLAQHVIADLTEQKLAGNLFESLRNKIIPLNDDLIVYPGHGAGSACGKKMSKETNDTLGHQKKTNYALNLSLSKEEFVAEVLNGLMPPPGYFPQNVLMNINGYENINNVLSQGTKALSIDEFLNAQKATDAIIIDTRNAEVFCNGFIPNSINIGLNGSFAVWAGTIIPKVSQAILLVCDEGKEEEVVTRLSRVGYDNTLGFLKGGIETWKNAGKTLDTIQSIDATKFYELHQADQSIPIIDVRKQSEFESEHLIGAINVPLDYLHQHNQVLDENKTYYVHCAGGYRSMTFISILKAMGYQHLIDVAGGINAIKATQKFELTAYKAPVTLL